jgi:hypothetical protein
MYWLKVQHEKVNGCLFTIEKHKVIRKVNHHCAVFFLNTPGKNKFYENITKKLPVTKCNVMLVMCVCVYADIFL